jgi:hypothetical protein
MNANAAPAVLLLLMATAMLNLFLAPIAGYRHNIDAVAFAFIALLSGQTSLVSLWFALGTSPTMLRGVVWGSVASACALGYGQIGVSFPTASTLFFAQACGVAFAGTLFRRAGFRWAGQAENTREGKLENRPRALQFSIRNLLTWTGIVAIVLFAMRYAELQSDYVVYNFAQFTGNALIAILSLWAMTSERETGFRVAIVIATANLLGTFVRIGFGAQGYLILFISLYVLQATFLLAWLGVCRASDCGVVRLPVGDVTNNATRE